MLGDEAQLARGRPRGVDHQMRIDQVGMLRERGAEDLPFGIIPDDAHEGARGAQRRDVARHVAGAADDEFLALDGEHRGRRLGRDALDLAIDIAVEHEVADAQHARAAELGQAPGKIEHDPSAASPGFPLPQSGGRGNRRPWAAEGALVRGEGGPPTLRPSRTAGTAAARVPKYQAADPTRFLRFVWPK